MATLSPPIDPRLSPPTAGVSSVALPGPGGNNPNPRKRGRTACTRCKTRKQKCDDQWPTCSNCKRSGNKCDKTAVTEDEPPATYTRALEERVAFLEEKLNESKYSSKRRKYDQYPQAGSPPTTVSSPGNEHHHHHNHNHSHHHPHQNNTSRSDALGEVVELLSHGTFEPPAYAGASSGLPLALNLGNMVQATVWNKAMPTIGDSSSSHDRERGPRSPGSSPLHSASNSTAGVDSTTSPARAITMAELVSNSAEPPSEELGSAMLRAYFNQLHRRYPFLNPSDMWELHNQRHTLRRTPVEVMTKAQRFGLFKLYMVYAIGAMLLQLTDASATSQTSSASSTNGEVGGLHPESYYMSALQHVFAARESRTTQNIEAMVMLVMYHLRSAHSQQGVWYMTGLAMRTCIDLGLHRKGNEAGLDDATLQGRRKLFWTVYSLERTIAVQLGRPFSIADRQIDVELPTAGEEETPSQQGGKDGTTGVEEAEGGAGEQVEDEGVEGKEGGGKPYYALSLALFRMRRLESRIYHAIYRVDKPLAALLPKVGPYYQELEEWKASIQGPGRMAPGADLNYALLHYHKAVRLLIQPFLPLLPPQDPYHRACLAAAGAVCQAHRRLQASSPRDYGHSFLAVKTVFVCGASLLYGLWTGRHAVWSVSLADDVRACSLVLFVMAERERESQEPGRHAWVRKYRDAFEALVSATMDRLQQQQQQQQATGEEATEAAARVAAVNHGTTASGDESGWAEAMDEAQNWEGVAAGREEWEKNIDPRLTSAAGMEGGEQQQQMDDQNNQNPEGGAWRGVMAEFSSWVDQSGDSPVWMPEFETLQNLSPL